jgi:hypothetical protein
MVRKHVNDLRTIWEEAGLDLEVQLTIAGDELVISRG